MEMGEKIIHVHNLNERVTEVWRKIDNIQVVII